MSRGESTNSWGGGGGVLGRNSSRGDYRVQVRGNVHKLTSKRKNPDPKGGKPLIPPSSIRHWTSTDPEQSF